MAEVTGVKVNELPKKTAYDESDLLYVVSNGVDLKMEMGDLKRNVAPDVFSGATELTPGESGLVPTPAVTDSNKVLGGDGEWKELAPVATSGDFNDLENIPEITEVEANPSGEATEELSKLRVDTTIYKILTSKVYGEASGDLITIEDAMEAPLEDCKVTLEPQQDLHGYDSPWIGGAGKNKFETKMTTQTKRGITATVNEDGSVTFTGTTTSQQNFILNGANIFNLPSGEYILTAGISNPSYSTIMGYARYGGTNYPDTGSGVTITVVDTDSINFYVSVYPSFSGTVTVKPMIRLSSISDNTWQPYSNICPISGWDEANVNISPTTSAEDGTTYPIDLNGTRYGGTLDVVSGVLKVTDGYIASYNGETLPSTWISDRDVYAPNTSPTTGAEVVYKLITPQTIQLTPTAVKSLLGTNNIWADGEMYVKYRRDLDIFLNKLEARVRALEEG